MRRSCLMSLPLVALMASPALAVPSGSVGGTLYTDFSVPTTGGFAAFNVTRTYLSAHLRVDPTWSAHVTLNAYPTFMDSPPHTPTEASEEFLQLAYVQAEGLYPGSTMQLGLVALPWTEYEYSFWGYRMLGSVPIAGGLDKGTAFVPSWDRAFKLIGNHGFLSYALAAYNGEGFRANENSNSKGYQGRLTISPLAGLDVTAIGQYGDPTTAQGNRASGFLGYKSEAIKVAMQGSWLWDGNVQGRILSAYWVLGLPIPALPPVELVLRGDQIDPNLVVTGDERLETIAGLSVKPAREVTLTLDDQTISRSSGLTNVIALHAAVVL